MSYRIEKETWCGWQLAWGFSPRSHPKANSDSEAIQDFHHTTAKCRTPYRLVLMVAGLGYTTSETVLANHIGRG